MTGVGMMLKALGVNVTEENIRMIEALIPQIPSKLNEFVRVFNAALQDNQQRLSRLEAAFDELRKEIQNGRPGVDTNTGSTVDGSGRAHANGGGRHLGKG